MMPQISHPVRMMSYAHVRPLALQSMGADQYNVALRRTSYLKLLAHDVLKNESAAAILDVSHLARKLPGLPVWDHRLDQLVLPFDDTIYVDFGDQPHLVIDEEQGLAFEGAYITPHDDGESSFFMVYLVCNDPDFGADTARSAGDSMKRLGNTIQVEIARDKTVLESLQSSFLRQDYWADEVVRRDIKIIASAFDLTARSMIYLGSNTPDITHTRYGISVGRNVDFITELEVPVRRDAITAAVNSLGMNRHR